MHWLSLMAPQQPQKPTNMMMPPITISTIAAASKNCDNCSLSNLSLKDLSTKAQIPTATRAHPINWNGKKRIFNNFCSLHRMNSYHYFISSETNSHHPFRGPGCTIFPIISVTYFNATRIYLANHHKNTCPKLKSNLMISIFKSPMANVEFLNRF